MAGAREENDCLLTGTEQPRDDLEHCPHEVVAPPRAPAADPLGARRAILGALATAALGAVLLFASVGTPWGHFRDSHREALAGAGFEGLVIDQQVYPDASGAAAAPVAGAGAAPVADPSAAGYTDPAVAATAAGTSGYAADAATGYTDQTGVAGATDPYGEYSLETTPPPYTGPLEFTGKGGPPAVAGTKLISAGAEDAEAQYPHAPVPEPPEDYAQTNPAFSIYMYRAQSDTDYPMRNVNTGDLAGVLWYLHNEIVAFPDLEYQIRHFNITRIIRFKVTVQNPSEFFERHQTKFGAYVAFGAGKCSVPNCDSFWQTYGAVVGCQAADVQVANYHSSWKTQAPETHCQDGCDAPLWYSLPGPCPSHEYGAKSPECVWDFPGGDCGEAEKVNGAKDCTYFAEWYGQVYLDELLNFTFSDGRQATFAEFLAAGGKEYDKVTDTGTFTSFWDGVHDETAGRQRVEAIRYLFQQKYPKYPTELEETQVLCDFNGWSSGEFAPLPAPGSG